MLQNKVAVITGAASGIGEAAARLFVKEGARVVLGDIQVDKLTKLVSELGGADTAVGQACDVGEEGDVEALVGAAQRAFGRLDIMVNNAGIAGKNGCPECMMERLDMDEFDRQIKINLRGVALGIKHAGRAMKAAGTRGGCIINTASVAGLIANCSAAGDPVIISAGYGASKAAVVHMTRVAACELCESGIRVNAVAPGYTATPMVGEVLNMPHDQMVAFLAKTSPLPGQAIAPSDVANGMLYLASDMGRCVNGHALAIDCGLVAGVAGRTYTPQNGAPAAQGSV